MTALELLLDAACNLLTLVVVQTVALAWLSTWVEWWDDAHPKTKGVT